MKVGRPHNIKHPTFLVSLFTLRRACMALTSSGFDALSTKESAGRFFSSFFLTSSTGLPIARLPRLPTMFPAALNRPVTCFCSTPPPLLFFVYMLIMWNVRMFCHVFFGNLYTVIKNIYVVLVRLMLFMLNVSYSPGSIWDDCW